MQNLEFEPSELSRSALLFAAIACFVKTPQYYSTVLVTAPRQVRR